MNKQLFHRQISVLGVSVVSCISLPLITAGSREIALKERCVVGNYSLKTNCYIQLQVRVRMCAWQNKLCYYKSLLPLLQTTHQQQSLSHFCSVTPIWITHELLRIPFKGITKKTPNLLKTSLPSEYHKTLSGPCSAAGFRKRQIYKAARTVRLLLLRDRNLSTVLQNAIYRGQLFTSLSSEDLHMW